MEFKRDYYLQKLIRTEQNDMIKIVTGVRHTDEDNRDVRRFEERTVGNEQLTIYN